MNTVYVLVSQMNDYDDNSTLILGIYTNEDKAKEAEQRYLRNHNFELDKYEIVDIYPYALDTDTLDKEFEDIISNACALAWGQYSRYMFPFQTKPPRKLP